MADLPGIASMEKHELKNKYRDWAILPEFDSSPIHILLAKETFTLQLSNTPFGRKTSRRLIPGYPRLPSFGRRQA
jgi:hypothetical protein